MKNSTYNIIFANGFSGVYHKPHKQSYYLGCFERTIIRGPIKVADLEAVASRGPKYVIANYPKVTADEWSKIK